MSYETNFYYNPKESGLEIVGVLDQPNMSYEYNTLVVWKHIKTGKLYYASDVGCSCPTPFENFTSLSALTRISKTSFNSFRDDVDSFGFYSGETDHLLDEKQQLYNQVKQILEIK